MNAAEVKDALRRRHPATVGYGSDLAPGPWTCLEEWMNIDLLAVAAWASVRPFPRYARVGYEVKASRSDYKRELANRYKRAAAVAFCHEFYFAVPRGLLKPDEIAWTPPLGFEAAAASPFARERCPGFYGASCRGGRVAFGCRAVADGWGSGDRRYEVACPTCAGAGTVGGSLAERAAAPRLWVPADVGLVLVEPDGRTIVAKKAPRRKPGARAGELALEYALGKVSLSDAQFADLVRWVSVRPDPRHRATRP